MVNKAKKTTKRKYTRKIQTPAHTGKVTAEAAKKAVQNASSAFVPDTENQEVETSKVEPIVTTPKGKKETQDEKLKAAAQLRAAHRGAAKNLAGLEELKLLAPKMPGFVLRWVKDTGNRLANVQRKGYIFVSKDEIDIEEVYSTDEGDKVSQVGGTDNGNPFRLYLMKIPEEWFKEDAEQKETNRRATEDQIRRANVGSKGLGGSEMYNPNPHANHLNPPVQEDS